MPPRPAPPIDRSQVREGGLIGDKRRSGSPRSLRPRLAGPPRVLAEDARSAMENSGPPSLARARESVTCSGRRSPCLPPSPPSPGTIRILLAVLSVAPVVVCAPVVAVFGCSRESARAKRSPAAAVDACSTRIAECLEGFPAVGILDILRERSRARSRPGRASGAVFREFHPRRVPPLDLRSARTNLPEVGRQTSLADR